MSDARNEFIAGRLSDREDEAAWRDTRVEWETQRALDLGLGARWVSTAEMRAHWAAERAAVEAQSHREHVAELARAKEQRGTAA